MYHLDHATRQRIKVCWKWRGKGGCSGATQGHCGPKIWLSPQNTHLADAARHEQTMQGVENGLSGTVPYVKRYCIRRIAGEGADEAVRVGRELRFGRVGRAFRHRDASVCGSCCREPFFCRTKAQSTDYLLLQIHDMQVLQKPINMRVRADRPLVTSATGGGASPSWLSSESFTFISAIQRHDHKM